MSFFSDEMMRATLWSSLDACCQSCVDGRGVVVAVLILKADMAKGKRETCSGARCFSAFA